MAPLRRDGGCPAGASITLDTTLIHYSNLTLLASFHHTPHTIRRALEFIETGAVRAADFVDGESPLTQLPELFKSMAAGNHGIKTLIRATSELGGVAGQALAVSMQSKAVQRGRSGM